MKTVRLFAFAGALLSLAAPARAEVCTDRSAGQYASNSSLCVSSALAPRTGATYGPENLAGETDRAWCEGAPGDGKDEYVRITYAQPVRFKTLLVGNGYAKSPALYAANARARTVRIETGDGLRITAMLPDRGETHAIRLPRTAKTRTVRLTIVDVYRGEKHRDLCLHLFTPNFEEMDSEN